MQYSESLLGDLRIAFRKKELVLGDLRITSLVFITFLDKIFLFLDTIYVYDSQLRVTLLKCVAKCDLLLVS